jgi:aspartate/methionine/tyrosine aminotransferase
MVASAKRLELVQEYYFAAKLREIAQMQQAGRRVLNLGIGSPDLPPHPSVVAALQHHAESPKAHAYQSYSGIPALRQAWADWYAHHYAVALDPEQQILPLIGSKEGIVHIAMAFLEPGDLALVPDPGYPAYSAATLLAGAGIRHYPLQAEHHWAPDLDALEKSDLNGIKLMWVNYPHMPTGAAGSAALFQRLVDFGIKHNILIVNDNPYSFILNEQPRSILAAQGSEAIALELNSLSKAQNMAGWRVGMVAGHQHYVKAILRYKSNMDSGQFLPVQHAAVEALRLPDTWYRQLNETYRERQRIAFQILENIGCSFERDQQGLFVWAKIPPGFADGFALSDALLHEKELFLTPGGIFGSQGQGYIRISLCSDVATLQEAARRALSLSHPSPSHPSLSHP